MTHLKPGLQVSENNGVTISIAKWEDLDDLNAFVNSLSAEDAHDLFAGETIHKSEHASYLANTFIDMEFGHTILLVLRKDGKFVGFGGVYREKKKRSRSLHVGIFHIGIAKEFRNTGYGFLLGSEIINVAKRSISNLRSIELNCFGNNPGGIRLYQKLGFVEVGRIPERYSHRGEYVDMVLMSQKIV